MKDKYDLPKFSLVGLRLDHHLDDLREIQEFLESRRISTKSTRIVRYIKYFENIINNSGIDAEDIFKNARGDFLNSDLTWYLYVLREVHELMFVLKGLKVHIPKGVDEKLLKITAGSDFAALDKNTEHRNTQFELRIASYFCQAGYSVDVSTDTDIVAKGKDRTYYVECKRVASIRAIRANLEKAQSQLLLRMPDKAVEKKVFGLIAMDVTKAGYSHNGLTLGVTPEHSRDVVRAGLYKASDEVNRVAVFTPDLPLIGCLLQIHIPSLIEHPLSMITRFSTLFDAYPVDVDACEEVNSIVSCGGKDDERCTPSAPLEIRKRIDVPAGTSFSISDDLVKSFMFGQSPEELDIDEHSIISTLTMIGEKYEFSFFDYKRLCSAYTVDERKEMFNDMNHGRVGVVLEMYAYRFRYV